jgi:DNA-binding GntR family transcriptional regulator
MVQIPSSASSGDASGRAPAKPGQPRYAWLRERILKDIGSGKYAVGSLLPSEVQLAKTYGVSRHTVREATRTLVGSGQISPQPGHGTRVCSVIEPRPYVAGLGTAEDLIAYTNATRLEVLRSGHVVADAALAQALCGEEGSRWVEVEAFRHAIEGVAPISFSRVYLRPEFADIVTRLRGRHMSIYLMLEQHHQQKIHTVHQQIEAMLMPARAAKLLGVAARSPALHMRRIYLDASDRVLVVSANLYAAERFRLENRWSGQQAQPAARGSKKRAA